MLALSTIKKHIDEYGVSVNQKYVYVIKEMTIKESGFGPFTTFDLTILKNLSVELKLMNNVNI